MFAVALRVELPQNSTSARLSMCCYSSSSVGGLLWSCPCNHSLTAARPSQWSLEGRPDHSRLQRE
ncbi:hypothetical protein LINPERPRIM_LOCUS19118 [Linum perenne]